MTLSKEEREQLIRYRLDQLRDFNLFHLSIASDFRLHARAITIKENKMFNSLSHVYCRIIPSTVQKLNLKIVYCKI